MVVDTGKRMAIFPLILILVGIFMIAWLLISTKAKSKQDKERYP